MRVITLKSISTQKGGGGGVIVNVSSIAASLGSPHEFIDYAATKGAIDTFTVGLAKEVAEEGIRGNALSPEKLKAFIPLKQVGRSVEVAHAILWLLSDDASYVTDSLLDVSGGR